MKMEATPNKRKKIAVDYSDPGKILELILGLVDDSCAAIQAKINQYLIEECEADLVFMIIVHTEHKEAFIETIGKILLTRKIKLFEMKKILDIIEAQALYSELTKFIDPEIQDIIQPCMPTYAANVKKRIIMMPFIDKPFSVVVCVIASALSEEIVSEIIYECFLFSWPVLKKSLMYEFERSLKHTCQKLLRVAKTLFTKVNKWENLLQITMDQAKNLTKSQFCSLKLVDFDTMELYEVADNRSQASTTAARRFALDRGITGEVLKSGQFINCRSTKDHKLFKPDIDSIPDVNCRNMICFPIREQTGIIGVGQLINKIVDPYYDTIDEQTALAFSMYCGVSIINSMVYKKMEEAHIRNALANELVLYYVKVTDDEAQKMLECTGYHGYPTISRLQFNSRIISERELPCYVLTMYKNLSFLKPDRLVRFILHVRKGYRDVPYHNWHHAFNAAQFAYAAIQTFRLIADGYISELQGLMYLTAALVHDVDHRGATNNYQVDGKPTLVALYSSEGSVMEHHHLVQALSILNTEGCDMLESLTRSDYDKGIMMLRDYVLATDISNYFKNMQEYQIIAKDFIKGSRTHTAALMSLLMTAADLCDHIKEWNAVKKNAAAFLAEYLKEGGKEKEPLLLPDLPTVVVDRENCCIPELEIQFITNICIPLYTLLGQIVGGTEECITTMESHIERWDASKPIFETVSAIAGLSVLMSPELDGLINANIEEKERLRKEAEEEAIRLAEEAAAEEARAAAAAAAAAAEEDD